MKSKTKQVLQSPRASFAASPRVAQPQSNGRSKIASLASRLFLSDEHIVCRLRVSICFSFFRFSGTPCAIAALSKTALGGSGRTKADPLGIVGYLRSVSPAVWAQHPPELSASEIGLCRSTIVCLPALGTSLPSFRLSCSVCHWHLSTPGFSSTEVSLTRGSVLNKTAD